MPVDNFRIKEKPKLIVIAGPTAAGKSSAAIRLAHEIGGEIISADSMQVYKGMDIGSAKIKKAEMEGVPHHLIDIIDPKTPYSAAVFKDMAKQAAEDIISRGRIPIVCGGTGFYIQALLYDIDFEPEDSDDTLKAELDAISNEKDGRERLAAILQETDPRTASSIDLYNSKRVIRAIIFYRRHGYSIAEHNERESVRRNSCDSPYDFRLFVLYCDRKLLYSRIDSRVGRMISDGLVGEVERLKASGVGLNTTAMQGIGYKEIYAYLDGETTLTEAIERIKINSRHYAKRQLTWFRREKEAVWLDTDKGDPLDEIRKYI